MKRVAMTSLALALLASALLPAPSQVAARKLIHPDPDDTSGTLDIEYMRWRVKPTPAGNLFVHTVRTYESFDPNEFYLEMGFGEEDPDFSDCYPGRCSGLWEGEIYWDDEEGLVGYLIEIMVDCGDCVGIDIDVRQVDERTIAFSIPEHLFYPDSRRYEGSFRTYWRDPLWLDLNIDCRVRYCVDTLPDSGDLSFPIVRRAA
ncbi:MAG: hypothetical protein M3N53_06345 [Actinomycetota bacterium]|nr:hypothetical protein [Actinomycetota bacterium]